MIIGNIGLHQSSDFHSSVLQNQRILILIIYNAKLFVIVLYSMGKYIRLHMNLHTIARQHNHLLRQILSRKQKSSMQNENDYKMNH